MRELSSLGLTAAQHQEVLEADPLLVAAWLDRIDEPDVTSPVGFFITGVRSGEMPFRQNDEKRGKAVHLAERWLANVGLYVVNEADVRDELFDGPNARLWHWRDDEALREEMSARWRRERVRGQQAEREHEEYLARLRPKAKP